ncbi:hypothetical protein N8D56_13440 [Devosia sp. A8/3-2]|nr:hypothetical protein N8D56_13440 [Devosia sp. A8/3-2]
MIYGRTLIWHSRRTGQTADDFFYDLGTAPDRVVVPPDLLTVLLENQSQTPTTCNALMRSAFLHDLGGFESRFRGMFEDQVFLPRPCWRRRPTFLRAIGRIIASTRRASRPNQPAMAAMAERIWHSSSGSPRMSFAGHPRLGVLTQLARLAAQTCWAMIRPRRPSG